MCVATKLRPLPPSWLAYRRRLWAGLHKSPSRLNIRHDTHFLQTLQLGIYWRSDSASGISFFISKPGQRDAAFAQARGQEISPGYSPRPLQKLSEDLRDQLKLDLRESFTIPSPRRLDLQLRLIGG